jgi:hypothetical protein
VNRQGKMPLWVALAFSNIRSRKGALYLVYGCAIFTVYCFPWGRYFTETSSLRVFLIDDWNWFAFMAPTSFWYWLSLRWIDNNYGWEMSE